MLLLFLPPFCLVDILSFELILHVYNLILSLFQTNHEHLFLQGEECLYLNTGDMVSETQELLEGNGTRPVIGGPVGHSTLVSNKQWLVLQVGSSIGIL